MHETLRLHQDARAFAEIQRHQKLASHAADLKRLRRKKDQVIDGLLLSVCQAETKLAQRNGVLLDCFKTIKADVDYALKFGEEPNIGASSVRLSSKSGCSSTSELSDNECLSTNVDEAPNRKRKSPADNDKSPELTKRVSIHSSSRLNAGLHAKSYLKRVGSPHKRGRSNMRYRSTRNH